MRKPQKTSKIIAPIILLSISLLLFIGVATYVYVHKNVRQSAGSVNKTINDNASKNSEKDTKHQVLEETPAGIKLSKAQQDISSTTTAPPDWKSLTDDQYKVKVVYPAGWNATSHVVRDPDREFINFSVSLDTEKYQKCCSLVGTKKDLYAAIKQVDDSDEVDDGRVDNTINTTYTDVIEKSPFIFKEHQAIRYVMTNRPSDTTEKIK